jgi:AMMECR1 domain-containing protein
VYATLGALTKEYRYKPIGRTEWQTLKPQVTVVRALEPISGIRDQNPIQDGLMVRAGNRSGVILPGEARDAFYQLVQCKLKAGVRPGESYQLYRIVADVYQ